MKSRQGVTTNYDLNYTWKIILEEGAKFFNDKILRNPAMVTKWSNSPFSNSSRDRR